MNISRRTLLAAMAAETALSGFAMADGYFQGPSLHALARAKGLGFGTCLGTAARNDHSLEGAHASSFEDPAVRALALAECGLLVPENELKWYAVRPNAETFDFARADRLADFAQQNHLAMRGHTLLWNILKWMQPWERALDFGPQPAAAAENMLREHIGKVCGRYGTRIFSYDVINETVDPATGEMRDTPWTRALGLRLFDVAFGAAHEMAPHAELVYNDFMTWTDGNARHYAGVLKVLEYMRKKNIPVDALGIQGHIGTLPGGDGLPKPDEKAWRKFLDEATGMGYGLILTELDMEDQLLPADVAARDRATADFVRGYLDILLSYRQTRYVMAWGLVDKYSWLRNFQPRADGLPKRPCPYDDAFKPKPMRAAIADALRSAPERPASKFA